ncbi:MAG: metal-dependent hydrolase, partial [Planctomycetales bacterium]|nr:metal-dependent hydrolase [Planctomycetales bacterium]
LVYITIRFFLAEIFRRYTVHRGMWHSLPAAALAGMFAFLIMSSEDISVRLFKTGAVVLGFMSHLILDEIWSVDFRKGKYTFKKSFGTALKLWGHNTWANYVTYGKLLVMSFLVYQDEGFMARFGIEHPDVPHTAGQLLQILVDRSEQWMR